MITVGVGELREDLSKLLQRVREEGEIIEITVRGEAVARVIPTQEKSLSQEEVTKQFTEEPPNDYYRSGDPLLPPHR